MRLAPCLLLAGLLFAPAVVLGQVMTVDYCVLQNGALTTVRIQINTTSNDSTYRGRPLSEVFPSDAYATGRTWYINNEPVTFQGRSYGKLGLPRVLGTGDVVPAGSVDGLAVFAEQGHGPPAGVIYVPSRPGCEFQPYQLEQDIHGVRGGA